jgi:hypothetical protein
VLGDVLIYSEILLVIDFMNLKINLTQSFRGTYRDRVCVHRGKCSYVFKYLYVYCVSIKKLMTNS